MTAFIIPPYAHISMESVVGIGPNFDITVGFPGVHGPVMTGIQGHGDPTIFSGIYIGFEGVLQNTNGMTFKKGTKSGMFPIGPALPIMGTVGKKVRGVGAVPKLQVAKAPQHKPNPILTPHNHV